MWGAMVLAGTETPEYQVNVSQENLINQFAVQGEENSRVLTLHLVENASTENALQQTEIRQKPLDLTGCTARLYTKKPDGNATFINGEIIATGADGNPNTVTFVLTQQTTAAAGNAHCTVAIFGQNGTELKATGITLDIAADDMEQTIVSTSEFVSLAEALGSVQESEQKADKAVLDAQTAVTNATTAITDITQKQAAMDTAESNRVTAESGRVTAESGRVAAEQSRVTAESARATAETKRETDSQTAVTAANAAAGRAGSAAQAAEKIAADVNATIVDQITAKTDITGGIAGYDGIHSHETNTDIHVTAEQRQAWNNKAEKAITSTTSATAAGWAGDTAPYTQNLSVSGVAEMSTVAIQPSEIATAEQRAAWRAALVSGTAASGKIMLIADGDRPATDIPVSITIWG